MTESKNYVPLRVAILRALRQGGTDLLNHPKRLIGHVLDDADPNDPATLIFERNCDLELMRIYSLAATQCTPQAMGDAAKKAATLLVDSRMLREDAAEQLACEIAFALSTHLGLDVLDWVREAATRGSRNHASSHQITMQGIRRDTMLVSNKRTEQWTDPQRNTGELQKQPEPEPEPKTKPPRNVKRIAIIASAAAVLAVVLIVVALNTVLAPKRVRVSAGHNHTVVLYPDGTARAIGSNENKQCGVSKWENLIAISAGRTHTVGLLSDGSVKATGSNDDGQCDVEKWKDIVAVSAGNRFTIGVKRDGSVEAKGKNDGGQCDVGDWKDIVSVSAGVGHTVGLHKDGTVVAAGKNVNSRCNVSKWKDIRSVSAGHCHTVGLRNDGTVVAVGKKTDGQCDVSKWKDIVAVSAGDNHTVGLRKDGTVVACGQTEDGQCEVDKWTDIVAIEAGSNYTIGVRKDGSFVSTKLDAKDDKGQCDVKKLSE